LSSGSGKRVNCHKYFSNPLPTTRNQVKQDTCDAACAEIVKNHMTELELLDTIAGPWNTKPDEDQSKDKDSNDGADGIPDPNGISGISEGDLSAVNNEPLSNMDEDMSDKYFSGTDEEDANRSTRKDDSLDSPTRKIPRTDNLLLARVQLMTKLLTGAPMRAYISYHSYGRYGIVDSI
jgi:hypothetical protein